MMNQFFRILNIAVILFLLINKVNAQHDYIVTLENDTVKGSIKSGLLSEYIFKSNLGKDISFSPKTVNAYYLSETRQKFISKSLPDRDKRYFLKILEEGKIMLYEQKTKTPEGLWIITWFAAKSSDELKDIITDRIFSKMKARRAIFSDLIADNSTVVQSFQEEKKYNFDVVRKYVITYNAQ